MGALIALLAVSGALLSFLVACGVLAIGLDRTLTKIFGEPKR